MESQRMSFPSEINLAPPNYFNCELVEVCSFWSECRKKKTKRRNRIFPFYFLIFQSYVVLKITRSRRLVALNVYGYYRCQYLNVLYVCNATLTSCFMFRNLKWLYHFVTRNVKRGWGGRVCYFYSKMFLVFSEHLKWFCTCPNIHSIHFQKRIIFI